MTLDQLDEQVFRAHESTETTVRTFGGAFVGQAVMAAGRTVPTDRPIHSAHGHFIRPGDPGKPVIYGVRCIRDGGTYSVRQVDASQEGTLVFQLTASFHIGSTTDMDYQAQRLRVSTPAELPPQDQDFADDPDNRRWAQRLSEWLGVDLRFPEPPARASAGSPSTEGRQSVWLRTSDELGDDPLLHAAALAYSSDLLLLSTGLAPSGRAFSEPGMKFASLDHTVWFHHPTRADEWFLHDMEALWNGHGRSLSKGAIFNESAHMVATTAQEGVVRPARN
ncbi:acyl-CoA thioesterase [Dietzia psychralcaliphila]|uniref:acyl-CoA thioesterase n=1 Tax=Dietzia psychralcaliphila TaxID=139021 RepID=UPI001C1E43D4|nr:acyl-CoA thioesterase domain-containing protein [Dietzia psychralcaliphila]